MAQVIQVTRTPRKLRGCGCGCNGKPGGCGSKLAGITGRPQANTTTLWVVGIFTLAIVGAGVLDMMKKR